MEANSLRTDSGLSGSPTLEEDSLSYCLELHGGILEPGRCQLDRALLEPRSAAAQLAAVESLALHVQEVLSKRRQRPLEEDAGYEFSPEWTGFSPSRSVSPALSDPILRTGDLKVSDLHSRRQTILELLRPQESCSSNGSVKGSTADKYRLSFVEVSDSSSDNDDQNSSRSMWQKMDEPLVLQSRDRAEETMVRERVNARLPEPEKITKPQFAWGPTSPGDLQYDDDEVFGPNPSILDQYSLPHHTRPNPETKEVKQKDSNKPSNRVSHAAKTTGAAVKSIDHASFSPLYTMSIPQLKHTVQLLETKLKGSGFVAKTGSFNSLPAGFSRSLVSLLEEKEELAAENELLMENIARITRYA